MGGRVAMTVVTRASGDRADVAVGSSVAGVTVTAKAWEVGGGGGVYVCVCLSVCVSVCV